MLGQNQRNRNLLCKVSTARNPRTHRRRKWQGAPPAGQHRHPTPEPTPSLPGMQPEPPGHSEASYVHNRPFATWIWVCTCSSAHRSIFNLDSFSQDCQNDTDYNSHMLTDEWTFTGLYTMCYVVMQLTLMLKTRAVCWANLPVRMSIDIQKQSFWVYYYEQLVDTVK